MRLTIAHAADIANNNSDKAFALAIVDSIGKSCILYRITASNATTPVMINRAAAPNKAMGPIILAINSDADIASNNVESATVFAIVDSIGNSCILYRITARIATTPVISNKEATPSKAKGPILLINNNEADITSNSTDKAAAATIDACIGKLDNAYNTPPNAATTNVMIIIVPKEALAPFAAKVIRANIPMSIDNAAVAPTSFFGSIIDKPATAAAIKPIATVRTINSPLQFVANLVTAIIIDINIESIPIAAIPFASPLKSIRLNRIATPANMPIATDIASIVIAIFGTSGPTILTIAHNPAIIPVKARIAAPPFTISSTDSIPTSLHTPTMSNMDTDTDKSKPPSFAICLSFPICVTFTRPLTNRTNAVAKAAPLSISSAFKVPANLHTPIISNMAIDIFKSIFPRSSALKLLIFVIAASANTNQRNATANAAPFIISEYFSILTSFTTPTIRSIAIDILINMLPSLLI